mgnify:CR=1 FL=1|jgi:HAD superfamily hydrolase (TIGR01509 family)
MKSNNLNKCFGLEDKVKGVKMKHIGINPINVEGSKFETSYGYSKFVKLNLNGKTYFPILSGIANTFGVKNHEDRINKRMVCSVNEEKNYLKLHAQSSNIDLSNPFIAKDLEVDKKELLENWIKYKRKSVKKNFELEKTYKKLKKDYIVASMSGVLDIHYKLCNEKKVYDVFEFNICSYKVKTNKPDLKIYKLLLKKLKLKPEEIVFIDDTPICVDTAKKIGMNAILYKNNGQLKGELRGVLG